MLQLYEKFYEQAALKQVRQVLDSDASDPDAVRRMVADEGDAFTDYLNFFEFIAYLRQQGQLTNRDVNALFEYYLDCMWRHSSVRSYVANPSRSYHLLSELLQKGHNRVASKAE